MENSSGQGASAAVPPEINKWNWGAFLLNWIWGIGNSTFIALLMFVPFVNMVMVFVLGARGSAWAWRNKRWESVEHFQRVQRQWVKWGLIAYAVLIVFIAGLIFAVMSGMKNSDIYRLGVVQLQANTSAMAALGAPLSTGSPSGSIETSGPSGKANLSFGVEGSKARGTVFLDAVNEMGQWKIRQLELQIDGTPERINLNPTGGSKSRQPSAKSPAATDTQLAPNEIKGTGSVKPSDAKDEEEDDEDKPEKPKRKK